MNRSSNLRLHLLGIAFTGMVAAVDFLVPPVVACGVPYAAGVLLSSRLSNFRSTLGFAIVGSLLTILGAAWPWPDQELWVVAANRFLSLFIIWTATWLVLTRLRSAAIAGELTRYRDGLEEIVQQRTTALEATHEQLQRSERLASIGTLAAGIAHEINNPLGLILLQLQNGLDAKDNPRAVESSFRGIEKNVNRCAYIVKSVLRFAREESSEKQPHALNDIVQRAGDLTREHTERHHISLELELDESLPPILANPTALELVLVNLIHNAVHACRRGGTVTIRTRQTAETIRAVIRDDGAGMTEEQSKHALDPFYTTRFHKGGTGLGLSTCHGIVHEHGGTLTIQSQAGAGTTVTLDFPAGPSPDRSPTDHGEPADHR